MFHAGVTTGVARIMYSKEFKDIFRFFFFFKSSFLFLAFQHLSTKEKTLLSNMYHVSSLDTSTNSESSLFVLFILGYCGLVAA